MINEIYDKYKEEVLNHINTNQLFFNKVYNLNLDYTFKEGDTIPDWQTNNIKESLDYGNRLQVCSDKRVSLYEIPLYELMDGTILGKEYYSYVWSNKLLKGNPQWKIHLEITEQYKKGIIQEGQILLLPDDFLDNGYKFSMYNTDYAFVVSNIDDDGIVVLPPNCSKLYCLDKLEAEKIKKIICIGKKISPILVYIDKLTEIEDITNHYTYISGSNIDIEYYPVCINFNIDKYTRYRSNNEDIFFNSLICNLNTYIINDSKDIIKVDLSEIAESVIININTNKVNKYSESANTLVDTMELCINFYGEDCKIKDVTVNSKYLLNLCGFNGYINNLFKLNIYNCKVINIRKKDRYSSSNDINLSFLEVLNDFSPNTIIKISNSFCLTSKGTNFLERLYNQLKRLQENGLEVLFEATEGEKQSPSIDDIFNFYVLLFTFYNYGTNINTIAEKQCSFKEEYLKRISNLFGVCKSNIYGEMGYNEAIEKFCDNNILVELKHIDIQTGIVQVEAGAGVDLSLNVFQLYLLRMSGLNSPNIVSVSDCGYNKLADNYLKNMNGCEVLVFSNLTKNAQLINGKYENIYCFIKKPYKEEIIDYDSYKNIIGFQIYYAYPRTETNSRMYSRIIKPLSMYKLYGSDIYAENHKEYEKIKLITSLEKIAKQQKIESYQLKTLLQYVTSSIKNGLYGGKNVNCINVIKVTKSNIPQDLIMDNLYYSSYYSVFVLQDIESGKEYKVEEKTLLKLLKDRNLFCENINTTLLEGSLIWLSTDYDKQATESIERIKQANMLFKDDNMIPNCKIDLYECEGVNNYRISGYNIGEEFVMPSYISDINIEESNKSELIETYGEDSWVDLKRIIILNTSDKILDVTGRILTLFSDSNNIVFKKGMEFLCDRNTVYKNNGKILVISDEIHSSLLELPQNISINFSCNYLKKEDTKIVIRSGSTIYKCKPVTELDIEDNVTIYTYAFSGSSLKKVTIHGGKIPENAFSSCSVFEKLIIDGGHVDISITAFMNCDKFESIECINGGTYTLIEKDNPVILEQIKESNISPFYNSFLKQYEENQSNMNDFRERVYPVKLNKDFTVTLKHESGSVSNLTLYQILQYYNEGKLILEEDINGEHYNFIEKLKYSDYKCLVFYPGINNDMCSCKLLLILDAVKDKYFSLSKSKFVFGFQYDDWVQGNVTDLPQSVMSNEFECGFYFDLPNDNKSVGVEFSIFQFPSVLIKDNWDDFYSYYFSKYNIKPEDYDIHRNYLDIYYFPASHSLDYRFRKQDVSGNNKNKVQFGSTFKYGKYFHAKKYRCMGAKTVIIIPGIGENKLFIINKIMDNFIHDNYYYLWSNVNNLIIKTPTIINEAALMKCQVYDNITFQYYNKTHVLEVYADLLITHCSVAFQKFKVYNSNIIYDCSNNYRLEKDAEEWLRIMKEEGLQDVYIDLDKNSTLLVKNLNQSDIESLILAGFNNLAYQLYNHSKQKDFKSDIINAFIDKINNGEIKINRNAKVLKLPKVEINILESVQDYEPNIKGIIDIYDIEPVGEEDITEEDSNTIELTDSIELIQNDIKPDKNKKKSKSISNKKDIDYISIESDMSVDFLTLGIDDYDVIDKEKEDVFNSLNLDMNSLSEQAKKEYDEQLEYENNKKLAEESNEVKEAEYQQKELLNIVLDAQNRTLDVNNQIGQEQLSKDKKENRNIAKEIYDKQSIYTDDEYTTQRQIKEKIIKQNLGLASDLLSAMGDKDLHLKKQVELELISEIYKEDKLVGYEVRHIEKGQVKKLSISTLETLYKTGKYKILGGTYSLFSGFKSDAELNKVYL